jgi:hypothetical protein
LYNDGYDDWYDDEYGAAEWQPLEWQEADAHSEYFGKGKGKGKQKGNPGSTTQGCDKCGSPNHNGQDCPWPNGNNSKGKGKHTHYESPVQPTPQPTSMSAAAIAAAPWSTAAWQGNTTQTTWHSTPVNNKHQPTICHWYFACPHAESRP